MMYPPEFVEEVKAEFPDNPDFLHAALDCGDASVGRILSAAAWGKDAPTEEADPLGRKRRGDLYDTWHKLYQAQSRPRAAEGA